MRAAVSILLLALAACGGQAAEDDSDDLVVSAEEPQVIEEAPVADPMPTPTPVEGVASEGDVAADTAASDGEAVEAEEVIGL